MFQRLAFPTAQQALQGSSWELLLVCFLLPGIANSLCVNATTEDQSSLVSQFFSLSFSSLVELPKCVAVLSHKSGMSVLPASGTSEGMTPRQPYHEQEGTVAL